MALLTLTLLLIHLTMYISSSISSKYPPNSAIITSPFLNSPMPSPDSTVPYGDIPVGSSLAAAAASTSSWTSPSGRFSFGFFRENGGFSVGIQLSVSSSETAVVWTAALGKNRYSEDAFLNFTGEGLFVTPEQNVAAFPLANFSLPASSASMLDSGNFVIYRGTKRIQDCRRSVYVRCKSTSQVINSSITLWRSFQSPTDTILGGQTLLCGRNLTSSAGKTDHSAGEFSLVLNCSDGNLASYKLSTDEKIWAEGVSGWGYGATMNLREDGRLYLSSPGGNVKDLSGYKPNNRYARKIYRATMDPDNVFRLYALDLDVNSSVIVNEIPYYKDKCQAKDVCGVNSYCFLADGEANCSCIPGFEYISRNSQVSGCRRKKAILSCAAEATMEPMKNVGGMDESAYGEIMAASREDCASACLADCDCWAASFADQRCLKLKLPLTGVRKDSNSPSVAFVKLAGAGGASGAEKRKRVIRLAAIFITAMVSVAVWGVTTAACLSGYWLLIGRYRQEWRRWEAALAEEIAPRLFGYAGIVKGTNEWTQQLGKGVHGTVYKADLAIGGKITTVAVKMLHGGKTEEGEKEFRAEMRMIGRAYHANLIRLLGFCNEGPSPILVYEFMPKGSLAKHIFEGQRTSWKRRVEILLGAARGIKYLHGECEVKIIHRDIKPENILVGEDWTAKISDFGLAKLLIGNQTRTMVAGTKGYVAPECEKEIDGTGEAQVTEKADVYGYGMVVLETICGKRNREAGMRLREMMRESWEAGKLRRLAVEKDDDGEMDIERIAKVGLLCVQDDPDARPFMEDVVMMLEGDMEVPTPPVYSPHPSSTHLA